MNWTKVEGIPPIMEWIILGGVVFLTLWLFGSKYLVENKKMQLALTETEVVITLEELATTFSESPNPNIQRVAAILLSTSGSLHGGSIQNLTEIVAKFTELDLRRLKRLRQSQNY